MKSLIPSFRSLFFFLALFIPANAHALSDTDQTDIKKAERYMNALDTAKARFVQTNADGAKLAGTFYLDRPGRVRFEYDEPVNDFIVADGLFIYFYDGELKEQTNAPIGNTLADFILRENIKFSGGVKVLDVVQGRNTLSIEATQESDPAAGTITLTFTKEPFTLKKWIVKDAQGLTTTVELSNVSAGIELPYALFVYADPKTGKAVYN
ncbi:MAG: LolA family protein [Alphaproteobacteria bacterium]